MTEPSTQTTRMLSGGAEGRTEPEPRSAPSPLPPGASAGRYLVIDELGRGGMGVVLRAYDPKLQREVALKVLRSGALDSKSEARLVREARAMAQLSHPNVVAVYDVDLEQDAGVMLAMEYVAGGTLRQWLRTPRPWREIVAAFVAAGRGLAAAHAKDLLHRDFKPANVLVTDDGRIKVTDFGLAKLGPAPESFASADADEFASMELTQTKTVMGTPRYMAPEQHFEGPLDPRADQYAFCVALWEALNEAPPFPGRSLTACARLKLDGPPPWPRGSAVPGHVREALARGLAAEREDRWASMSELLAVLERDPGVRRRRVALISGLTAALAGVAWWGVSGGRADHRCSGATTLISEAWGPQPRQRVEEAMSATGMPYASATWALIAPQLDAYAESWAQQHTLSCEATSIRKEQSVAVMDRQMACLHRAKVELSAVVDQLSQADAKTVKNAPRVVDRLPAIERCAGLLDDEAEVVPPDPTQAAAVAALEEELVRVKVMVDAGHYAEGLEVLDELEARSEALGYGPLRTKVLLRRGKTLDQLARYDEGYDASRRALRSALQWRQWIVARDAAIALVFDTGIHQRDPGAAKAHAETAWGLLQQFPDPLAEARLRSNLGTMMLNDAQNEQAEAEFREALSLIRTVRAPDHPSIAVAYNDIGNSLINQGKYEQAREAQQAALDLRLEALGPHHPLVANSRINLGNALQRLGRLEPSEEQYRAALPPLIEAVGPDHPTVGLVRISLGSVLNKRGEYDESKAEYHAALENLLESLGPDHPHVALVHNNLGVVFNQSGDDERAEAEYRAALEIRERTLPPNHPDITMTRANLAGMAWERGDLQGAEAEYRAVLAGELESLGPEHPDVAATRNSLASILLEQGEHLDEALEFAEAAWARRSKPDVVPERRAKSAFTLAKLLWARTDQHERARTLAQTARDAYQEADNEKAAGTVDTWLREHG